MTPRPRDPLSRAARRLVAWRTHRTVGASRAASLPAIALAGLLGGCASLPSPEPPSYLDERTGITLTVVDTPLVLARERRDLAANARDYLTLVAVSRNQSGRITSALLVHRWSTIDARVAAPLAADARLVIVADGRDIRPQPLAELPKEFQPSATHDLWRPPVSQVATVAYRIDAATLRFIAESGRVSAFIDQPGDALPYALWRDGRAALARFAGSAQ